MKQFAIIFLILIFTVSLPAQTKTSKKNLASKKSIKKVKKAKECERVVSFGVMPKDLIIEIPKPKYPTTAKTINLQNDVEVRVIVNKKGKVVGVNILKGHIFLWKVSLDSAWKSKFKAFEFSSKPICYIAILVFKFRR